MRKIGYLIMLISSLSVVTSCDYIDDILDNGSDDEEIIDDKEQDVLPPDRGEDRPRLEYEFDGYVKSISMDPMVYSEVEDEYSIKVLELMGTPKRITFSYNQYVLPSEVTHITYLPAEPSMDRIETKYVFTYDSNEEEISDVSALLTRVDYNENREPSYTYEPVTMICHTSALEPLSNIKTSEGLEVNIFNDDQGYVNSVDVNEMTYKMCYDSNWKLNGIEPGPDFPEHMTYTPMLATTNVDYNVLLMLYTPSMYSPDWPIYMLLKFIRHTGYDLMDKFFISSGSVGGLYYMSYSAENAGKVVHETVHHVKYNENWVGGDVFYNYDETTGFVSTMSIHVPVTLYEVQYDAVVSDQLYDPENPEFGYKVDRIENEVESPVASYDVVFKYSFEYYAKEEFTSSKS